MWSKKGTIDVIDLSNDFYLVKFYASEDFDYALLEGPWKIFDHYLTVRLWEPNFNPMKATIDRITAWVRLPGLPIELYDRTILRKIGNLIGRTVKVDDNTAKMSRRKFARLCVEVDLTKPLMGRYMINGEDYQVEYEGIHQICFTCGRIDHDQNNCTMKKQQIETAANQNDEQKTGKDKQNETNIESSKGSEEGNGNTNMKDKGKQIVADSKENYGTWMVVQRPKRGKKEAKMNLTNMGEKPANQKRTKTAEKITQDLEFYK
ncbi:uncharacterized protein LOC107496423 [Arachis duranensis]|uniref:Uncharacterized protein LOC107496423 n=1 Tax=Arachis duranensis TaxID=130453 RepID=A0A6P4DS76_ARADU|nr:uncharacterized protein LOC107496423 [Arachis duranensis]